MTTAEYAAKFDHSRASEYETQSRIALAGYDTCHELSACLLSASLGSEAKHVLVAGAGGTGKEFLSMGTLEPQWSFVAADPNELKRNIGFIRNSLMWPLTAVASS